MAAETWLILGGSSSIARAFAREAAAQGCDVVLAGRNLEDLERTACDVRIRSGRRAEVLSFDATAFDLHPAFVDRCRELAPNLNVLVVFGLMLPQQAIDADFALARRTVEVNYLGVMSILSRFAPVLQAQGRGCVVVLSSVAGDRGRFSNYVYGSAKSGLNTYLQGLRARLFRSGVSVTTVKAGFMDTAMTFGLPGIFLPARPPAAARAILRAAKKERELVYYPWFWRWVMLVVRAIPERFFKRLTI